CNLMVVNPNIQIIELEPNMGQVIVMLNAQKCLLFTDRLHLTNGEIMGLVVQNLIFGRQIRRLLFILLIHADNLDIIDATELLIVDLIIKDIVEFVIRMVMEIMLTEMVIKIFMVQVQTFKLIHQENLLL
ncbi:MAG: hypothetical protein ACKO96_12325, partial [Flammeovirgaceae bacterium]